MFKAPFVGRSRELEVLDNLWTSSRATLLILYGRRRVGKTRLLTHWLQKLPQDRLYWVAEPTSALSQLRSFSQSIISFIDPDTNVPADFSYATWEQALRQVALYAQTKRIAVFIDEVTYLIDVNPEFVGTLQKAWDQWLSDSNLMLVLSGSQMGLMQKNLLNYDAPLHGRATAQVKLPPLPFGATSQYFPNYDATERVQIYAMWGGVPAYWERLDPDKSVLENLRQNVLPMHAWMVDESRILLQDFITDLHNYVGIMRAIADGQHALSQISKRTGLASSTASFYLSVLRDTGFVARDVPISQRGMDSRRGRYTVTDPYLRFFYRFMSAYQSRLALGQLQEMLQLIQDQLPAFIETNTWQELGREWLLRARDNGELPVPVEDVGSEWARNYVIDVVGISEESNSLVLGDCYWQAKPGSAAEIEGLVKKTSVITGGVGDWTVYYVLFSANGWTEEAIARAEQIVGVGRSRKKWCPVGIRLLDLNEVDEDLARWSV